MYIVKLDDLINLSNLLIENNYSDKVSEIIFNVKTNEILNKINEEIYFRNKTTDSPPLTHVDEILLNINNIKFKITVDSSDLA